MGQYKAVQLLLASCILTGLAVVFCLSAKEGWNNGYICASLISGLVSLLLALTGIGCLDLARYFPAESHTISSLFTQYVFHVVSLIAGGYEVYTLQSRLKNPKKEQDKLLMRLLKENSFTEYGRRYNFKDMKNRDDYIHMHPLTTYQHFVEYINRTANNGEQNLITSKKIDYISLSSGTTGKNKMFPFSTTQIWALIPLFLRANFRIRELRNMKRVFHHYLYAKERHSPAGIRMGGGSSSVKPLSFHLHPYGIHKLIQEKPAQYAQCLVILAEKELGCIEGYSSNLMLAFFKFMHAHADQLCHDIEHGTVSKGFDIPEDIRVVIEKNLISDRSRAVFLRQEIAKGAERLARRIWPHVSYALFTTTGSFALCADILRESYLKGIQFVSAGHGASEGMCGMPAVTSKVWEDPVNLFLCNVTFFEFIKLKDVEKDNPKTFFIDQLQVGESYELVLTNTCGLYRIRLGDVIKVVRYIENMPAYEFQYRLGQRLSIAFERTPEMQIQKAVTECEKQWSGCSLVDFTTCESMVLERVTEKEEKEMYYVFFMELLHNGQPYMLTAQQKQQLDDTLGELHEPYKTYQLKGTISPLQVFQLKQGAFEELRLLMSGGYQNSQFKMPRVERRDHLIKFLLSKQVE